MKQTINFSQFCDAFVAMGRNGQFSYDAKKVLFDSLEGYEEWTGEQIELDVIALCCEYHEMSINDILHDYDFIDDQKEFLELSIDEQKEKIESFVQDRTTFCGWTNENNAVFAQF